MPLRQGVSYLPALPLRDENTLVREQGCGSPVSPTPPGSVIAAAELAHRVVIDAARAAPGARAATTTGPTVTASGARWLPARPARQRIG